MACQTRRACLRPAIEAVSAWCWSHRHEKVAVQQAALRSRLQAHYNYFGVNGNLRSMSCLLWHARWA